MTVVGHRLWLFLVLGGVMSGPLPASGVPATAHQSSPFAPFTLGQHTREDVITDHYRFVDGDSVLRLKVVHGVSRGAAERLIENEVLSTRALYSDALAPYPDALSNRVTVEQRAVPEFRSVDQKGAHIQYIVAFLSAGMTYGIQSAADAPYRGVLAWVFCEKLKEARSLELIRPVHVFSHSDEELAFRVACEPVPPTDH